MLVSHLRVQNFYSEHSALVSVIDRDYEGARFSRINRDVRAEISPRHTSALK